VPLTKNGFREGNSPRWSIAPRAVVAMATTLLVIASTADVMAQSTTQQCVDAHGEAQVLAKKTKLIEARSRALVCAQDSCPKLVKSECIDLLEDIRARVPSIVFAISGPDGDLSDVIVEADGKKVLDRVTGASLDVDPGAHTFVFRAEGYPTREKRLVVHEGEKRRLVEVTLGANPEPLGEPNDGPEEIPTTPGPEPPDDDAGGVPIGPVVFGAVGLVGLGMFAAFGAVGLGERSDLDACKPTCSDDEVDPVRTKFIIADISLAVGVVSLGVATIMLLSGADEPETGKAGVSVVGGPLPGGGVLGLGGAF